MGANHLYSLCHESWCSSPLGDTKHFNVLAHQPAGFFHLYGNYTEKVARKNVETAPLEAFYIIYRPWPA